ncbi:AcaB family transcriptional regulator [Citrobacter freundii]|uniref:AcaB family transcriptional regulator n=1 Tax=Citrobacter freundii TaxID=546 RepID=UPI00387E11D3
MLQVFSFVNRFRTTGVTRADVRANSPLAQTMAHKFGNLPKKMLAEILRDEQ